MDKREFDETCSALYEHENRILAEMLEYIKPYNDELNECGLKVECRLLWFYADETEEDKVCLTSRREIYRNRPYSCQISIGICPIECSFTIDEEYERGFSLWANVSEYALTILRGYVFKQYKCDRLYKKLDKLCPDVKRFGIDYVMKKYKLKKYG